MSALKCGKTIARNYFGFFPLGHLLSSLMKFVRLLYANIAWWEASFSLYFKSQSMENIEIMTQTEHDKKRRTLRVCLIKFRKTKLKLSESRTLVFCWSTTFRIISYTFYGFRIQKGDQAKAQFMCITKWKKKSEKFFSPFFFVFIFCMFCIQNSRR